MTLHDPGADQTLGQVSAEAVIVTAIDAYNPGAALAFLQLFNRPSADVTLGTTVPDFVVPIPDAGGRDTVYPGGLRFADALTYAVTGSPGGNDAPASPVVLSFGFAWRS